MKDIIKLIITHFFIITVSVLFFICLINQIAGTESYSAEFPWIIMLAGITGAIPSVLFYFKKEPTKKQFILRFIIHFIIVEIIIMTEGFFLNFYESFVGGLIIFAIVIFVYAVVCIYSFFVANNTANSINNALEVFNADEENQGV